jgi:hypothetical protein
LGRYITNEYYDAKNEECASVVNLAISRFSESLKLPIGDIIRAFYVDISLMACWDSEDGNEDINGILFAESLLKKAFN